MSTTNGTPNAAPGWYEDPAIAPMLRWWDGAQWTEHLHDPSAPTAPYNTTYYPVVGLETPVYNPFIWVFVFLPLASLIGLLLWDVNSYVDKAMSGVPFAQFTDPGYLTIAGIGVLTYAANAVLAYFDWRRLGRDGIARPFHWAWTFLSSLLYLIGRTVIVYRRSQGRGMAVIWVYIAVYVVSFVISIIKVTAFVSAFTQTLPSLTGTYPS